MAVYQRVGSKDWVEGVAGYGQYNTYSNTKAIIAHDKLWVSGTFVAGSGGAPGGVRYLYGLSLIDGSVQTTIDIIALGGNLYGNGDKAVDQNGFIWAPGEQGFHATALATRCIDVINNQLIAQVGSQSSGQYGGQRLKFDPTNNVVWVYKNTSTLQAISTISYTATYSIADRADGGFAVDYDKNEVWVFNNLSNTIKRYNATTGVLTGTVTSSHLLENNHAIYIPEKKCIVNSDTETTQIWSTETYTLISSFSVTNAYCEPYHYHTATDSLIGNYYSYVDSFPRLTAFKFDSPHTQSFFTLDLLPNTDPLGEDQEVHNAIAIGDDESLYFGVDNRDSGIITNTYFYKLSYKSVPIIELCSNEDTSSNNTELSSYDSFNRELILDLTLGAFSIYDIAHNNNQAIRDYIEVPAFYLKREDVVLYRGNDVVTDGSGVPLVITGAVSTVNRHTDNRAERFKFLVTSGTDISLAEYRDYRFVDWYSIDGVGLPFNSYLLTGYTFTEDLLRNKQTIYLKLFFERTEDVYTIDSLGNVVLAHQSGCKVQAHWNWNNSVAQGKWGVPFQGYRLLKNQPTSPVEGDTFDYGEKVIVTKNKLRGRGHCLSLLFVPECGKDTKLLGWGLDVTVTDVYRR